MRWRGLTFTGCECTFPLLAFRCLRWLGGRDDDRSGGEACGMIHFATTTALERARERERDEVKRMRDEQHRFAGSTGRGTTSRRTAPLHRRHHVGALEEEEGVDRHRMIIGRSSLGIHFLYLLCFFGRERERTLTNNNIGSDSRTVCKCLPRVARRGPCEADGAAAYICAHTHP